MPSVPNTLGLPTTEEATEILQQWQPDPALYIGASILPERGLNSLKLSWQSEKRTGGMTQAHSLDADPRLINQPGRDTFEAEPYFFKEGFRLNESDLLTVRQMNALNPTNQRAGRDLIARRLTTLDRRLMVRQEWLRWAALRGAMSIDENGIVANETWAVQTANPDGADWDSPSTADPRADFDAIKLLYRGMGATAVGANAYMNRVTAGLLAGTDQLKDAITNDRSAVRLITLDNVLEVFGVIAGVVPTIYDEGYIDSSDTFQPFIPDNKIIVVGRPTQGEELGFLASVPSLHNGGIDNPQPGKFVIIEDETDKPNPKYSGYAGWYGGTILLHPEYVVVFTVAS